MFVYIVVVEITECPKDAEIFWKDTLLCNKLFEKLWRSEWIPCFLEEISIFANLKYLVVNLVKAIRDNAKCGGANDTKRLSDVVVGLAFFR